MYRDELTHAKKRIEDLEDQLASHQQELAVLRAQVVKRLGGGITRRSRTRMMGAALVVLLAGAALTWITVRKSDHSTDRNAPDPASEPLASEPTARVVAQAITDSTKLPISVETIRGRVSDPGFRLDVPDEARVQRLFSRCPRRIPRNSLDGLPAGTHVIDFIKCEGCDCCLPGGEFPPAADEHSKYIPDSRDCRRCSRAEALARVGLTVVGGTDYDPLWGPSGLVFHLAKPSRVFALEVRSTSFQGKQPLPDHEVGLVAYDPNGRPIDGARATYPRSNGISGEKRTLLVEACNGETIGRVDLSSSDGSLRVKTIALSL